MATDDESRGLDPDLDVSDGLLFRWLAGNASPTELRSLEAWLNRSPANRERVNSLRHLLALVEEADARPELGNRPTAGEILSQRAERARVEVLIARKLRARSRVGWVTAAAVLLVGIAVAATVRRTGAAQPAVHPFGLEEFFTEPTEPATVGLRDGSVVRLAPGSRLRVLRPEDGRSVELTGRAYFAIAGDSTKPFTVRSQAGTVTVLGTRFDLEASSENLRLIVVEGRVALSSHGVRTVVDAGRMARVVRGSSVPAVTVTEIAPLVDWVGDFVAFQNTPLGQAATEIERHHGITIVFDQPELANRTITAWFAGRSLEEMMEVIGIITNTKYSKRGREIRLQATN